MSDKTFEIGAARRTLTNNGKNASARYAFDQLKKLTNGEEYLRKLFLGIDTGGMKYDTLEKFVELWVRSGRSAGGVLHAMQWQRQTIKKRSED